jgi:cytoskeletal protein CcmA (bactofilin family)
VKLYFFKEKPMKTGFKLFSLFTLLAILSMAIATPALAFDGRTGDDIVIEADEVINDDLYVTAQNFTLDGTVKGDLFVMGETIIINGTVEGDLFAGGQTIMINGTVNGDTRIGGAALQLGETAILGEDLLAGGASLETKDGSTTGGDLLVGSGQTLLAGDVAGDVFAGTGALELRGEFGGDVTAEVGDSTEGQPAPSMYMPNVKISLPSVAPGFTVSKDAVIKGDLVYTQSSDVIIPSNVVAGKITRNEPTVDIENTYVPPTRGELAMDWTFDLFRSMATLLVFGLLIGWLAPKFLNTLGEKIQAAPAASLGWGVVAYAAFFFSLLLIVVTMTIGAILFGLLTLGGVSGSIIWVGLLSIFALTVGFILVTSFLTKVVIAWLAGKMILNKLNPALAESWIWPLVLGVVLVALAISLPLIGWLFGLIITLVGLGAFWIWGQEARQSRQIAVV